MVDTFLSILIYLFSCCIVNKIYCKSADRERGRWIDWQKFDDPHVGQ